MDEQTKSRHVWWVSLVGGLAILILLLVGCNTQAPVDNGKNTEGEEVTPFPTSATLAKPTYTVERGDVVGLAHFSGRIRPVVERELYFRINGRTRKIYVQEGDTVTLTEAPEGGLRMTPAIAGREQFANQMKAAESVIRRYRNTLRELAK